MTSSSRTRLVLVIALAFLVGVGAGVGGVGVASRLLSGQPLLASGTAAGTSATPTASPAAKSPTPVQSPTPEPVSPAIRYSAGGAFDQARGKLVLFGGQDLPDVATGASGSPVYTNETWTWDGHLWTLQHPIHSPSARSHAAMAYDAARRLVVLEGGTDRNWLNDSWTWDGSDWKQVVPLGALPFNGGFPVMTYDSGRKAILLVPQTGPCPCIYPNDVWSWDGTTWTKLATTGQRPPGNAPDYASMAYLPTIKSTVFFTRMAGSPTAWALDDALNWTQLSSSGGSSSGEWSTAFDDRLGAVVLVGNLGDAWSFDGTQWKAIGSVSPLPIARSVTVFDSVHGMVIYFADSAQDTWTWDGSKWSRAGLAQSWMAERAV